MANLNRVLLIGNLTRDPELRYTPKGTAVTEIGLAINRIYSGEDGEKKEETTFVDVTLWARQAEEILVVVDDVALPLGRLRLRPSGSDGGHNGLKSLIAHLGEDFMRLRIGIGASGEAGELSDHVLGKFDRPEQPTIDRAIERAEEAIEHVAHHGIASAMNHYNKAE